ncbi:MAG: nucleotidyl transferase AbiEii/AbiGii toxin family protein [Candidatus Omnitrophica bacterium]|nr:nucleotidyl transferase AbiEii/AbiGii toxin family protein [Candidatus Omnitrophota bacterium]
MEVLEALHSEGALKPLVFGGGTMLRLCHELPRYSVDLDFWFVKRLEYGIFFKKMLRILSNRYEMTDHKSKRFTLLFEFRSGMYHRRMKIEIRKEMAKQGIEERIAFSKYGSRQVLVKTLSLEEMARRKVEAALTRSELRDYFDLEFLIKKGIKPEVSNQDRKALISHIHQFTKRDYQAALGGLLEKEIRAHYEKRGFESFLNYLASRSITTH